MKLKFLPHGDRLVRDPERPFRTGVPASYVGREYKREGKAAAYPATGQPHVVDTDKADIKVVARLVKCCRRGDLLPADEATAKVCQVEFQKPVMADGECTGPKGMKFHGGRWHDACPKKRAARREAAIAAADPSKPAPEKAPSRKAAN